MNRRIAAVRGLFEFAVMTGARADNPVPAARRSSGLRASRRGLLGHIGRAGRAAAAGWCASRVGCPRRWSRTTSRRSWRTCAPCRDRAITLADAAGRAARRRGPVAAAGRCGHGAAPGAGDRARAARNASSRWTGAFFAELAAYLREERPAACRTAECFVVLRGPTAGQPLTEAGLRRIFRTHRLASGAVRVRPHRLRHTYGTELASRGHRLAGAAGPDGPRQPGDHGRLRAPVTGDARRRVRPGQGGGPVSAAGRRHLAPPGGAGPAGRLRRRGRGAADRPGCAADPAQRRRAPAGHASAAGGVDEPADPGAAGRPEAHRGVAVPDLVFRRGAPAPDLDLLLAKTPGDLYQQWARPASRRRAASHRGGAAVRLERELDPRCVPRRARPGLPDRGQDPRPAERRRLRRLRPCPGGGAHRGPRRLGAQLRPRVQPAPGLL